MQRGTRHLVAVGRKLSLAAIIVQKLPRRPGAIAETALLSLVALWGAMAKLAAFRTAVEFLQRTLRLLKTALASVMVWASAAFLAGVPFGHEALAHRGLSLHRFHRLHRPAPFAGGGVCVIVVLVVPKPLTPDLVRGTGVDADAGKPPINLAVGPEDGLHQGLTEGMAQTIQGSCIIVRPAVTVQHPFYLLLRRARVLKDLSLDEAIVTIPVEKGNCLTFFGC